MWQPDGKTGAFIYVSTSPFAWSHTWAWTSHSAAWSHSGKVWMTLRSKWKISYVKHTEYSPFDNKIQVCSERWSFTGSTHTRQQFSLKWFQGIYPKLSFPWFMWGQNKCSGMIHFWKYCILVVIQTITAKIISEQLVTKRAHSWINKHIAASADVLSTSLWRGILFIFIFNGWQREKGPPFWKCSPGRLAWSLMMVLPIWGNSVSSWRGADVQGMNERTF